MGNQSKQFEVQWSVPILFNLSEIDINEQSKGKNNDNKCEIIEHEMERSDRRAFDGVPGLFNSGLWG